VSLFKILSSQFFVARSQDEIGHEIDEELRFHIEMRTEDLIASGITTEKAREIAAHRFGDMERVREMCCEVRRGTSKREAAKPLIWMLAGFALVFWTMSREYTNLQSVFLLLTGIAIMLCSLFNAHRLSLTKAFAYALAGSGESEKPLRILETDKPQNISAHDAQGRTPVERVLDDE